MDELFSFIGFLAICFGVGLFEHWIGFSEGVDVVREDAIKHGVGEYYLDEKHEKQFRWKESK